MHICTYIYSLKFELLSLYNVTWMYVFRSGSLVLYNQMAYTSQETISPAISNP